MLLVFATRPKQHLHMAWVLNVALIRCILLPAFCVQYAPTGNTNGGFAANVSPPTA
jgi:hypothetical protein